jgi:hypothetical protein
MYELYVTSPALFDKLFASTCPFDTDVFKYLEVVAVAALPVISESVNAIVFHGDHLPFQCVLFSTLPFG